MINEEYVAVSYSVFVFLFCPREGQIMCFLFADEVDILDDYSRPMCFECGSDGSSDVWWEDICVVWSFVTLVGLISIAGLALAAYSIKVNVDQGKIIDPLEDDFFNKTLEKISSTVDIHAHVDPQFYGITVTGLHSIYSSGSYNRPKMRGEHISTSQIYPRVAVPYINGFCSHDKNGVFTKLYTSFQFSADFRKVTPTTKKVDINTTSRQITQVQTSPFYDYLEIRFEVPFGDVMVPESGAGYYGYKTSLFETVGEDNHQMKSQKVNNTTTPPSSQQQDTDTSKIELVRKRCPVPYCLTWREIDWLGGIWGLDGEDTSFVDIARATIPTSPSSLTASVAEFFTKGTVKKRVQEVAVSNVGNENIHNQNVFYYDKVVDSLSSIRCGCSGESPMRFACILPAHEIMNQDPSTYTVDLEIKYPVKPTGRKPIIK